MNRTLIFGMLLLALLVVGAGSCSKPPGQGEYDRALYELKRNNAVRAKALLEKSIARRPGAEENALAYNYLGVAAGKLGQFQAAQEAFEDSHRLGPRLLEPVLNLAQLAASSGDQLRALKLLEEASRMDERDTRALEFMAVLYGQRQQWPEAQRMLHAALDRAPDTPRIHTAIANVQVQTQGPTTALETLLRALEHNARYAPALFNLALIYDVQLQDAPHARSFYRRFLGVSGSGPQADFARRALQRIESAGNSSARPAPVEHGASEPVARVDEIPPVTPVPEPVVVKAEPVPTPTPPPPAEDSVQTVVRRAAKLAEQGDSPAALNLLLESAEIARRKGRAEEQAKFVRDAARLCFDEPRAHFELGRLLMSQNNPEAALTSFKQATTLDRNYTAAHLALARAALQTGEYDAALVGFQSAAKADPRDANAVWELARLLDDKMKNTERALDTYRDFERMFPGDPRVLQAAERAQALAAVRPAIPVAPPRATPTAPVIERPISVAPPVNIQTSRATLITFPVKNEAAVRQVRQVKYKAPVTPNPRAALLAFNQGAEYQQQGNWDSAIYYYLRSLENDDRLGTTFYNLGSAYAGRGEAELAKDAYLRSLQLQPELVSARYNLALLYFQAGDLSSAEKMLNEVVRQKPDYAAAHYTLGMIYAKTPDATAQARQAYERYLKLAPHEPAAAVVRQWLSTH